jgi:Flp pilus assembly protein TadG
MAIVEMALVGTLLVFLLFGILIFGYLMSFRQNMTQAAAEGARAGAVAASGQAQSQATAAVSNAVGAFGQTCGSGGMVCTIPAPTTCTNNPSATCITVTLTFHYSQHPLLPDVPLISPFLPTDIVTSSVAEVNT